MQSKEKEQALVEDKNQDNQEEEKESCLLKKVNNKTYLNLYCCQINIGLIFTYIYIFVSASLNVINRILFQNYYFHFNFTLSLCQQFVSLLLYTFAGRNKTFIKHAGQINFADFWKYKIHYFSFAFIFMANILFNFYGNQMVDNVNMFLSLRKLNAIALFLMDIYIGKKKFSCVTVSSIFLIVGGSFVIGYDKLDSNYKGYLVVIGNNLMSLLYTKYSEVFRSWTGFSNLKLLVYNAYICNPILLAGIFITGENKRLAEYLTNNAEGIEEKYHGYYGTAFFLFLSCFFCFILTSSFFISNEKISSLMTNLLNNSRTIFISASLYFFDSSKNELNLRMVIGLSMSTIGAIFINAENLINNLIFNTKPKENNKKEEPDNKDTEMLEIKDGEEKDANK
jgi:hypothetical protein